MSTPEVEAERERIRAALLARQRELIDVNRALREDGDGSDPAVSGAILAFEQAISIVNGDDK